METTVRPAIEVQMEGADIKTVVTVHPEVVVTAEWIIRIPVTTAMEFHSSFTAPVLELLR